MTNIQSNGGGGGANKCKLWKFLFNKKDSKVSDDNNVQKKENSDRDICIEVTKALASHRHHVFAVAMCSVCLCEQADHALIPCGHFALCKKCFLLINSSSKKLCVICNAPFDSGFKIFISYPPSVRKVSDVEIQTCGGGSRDGD